jgi:hypothetical protein
MVTSKPQWPDWWYWELDCSNPHLLKRMSDRSFNEVDLREMLEIATGFRPDEQAGRWVIVSSKQNRPWEIVVEPDESIKTLVVVTAYPAT